MWLYPDDAGDPSEKGRNAANLISDGGGLFALFFLKLVPWFCSYHLNESRYKTALALKLKLLKRKIGSHTLMMLGIRQ